MLGLLIERRLRELDLSPQTFVDRLGDGYENVTEQMDYFKSLDEDRYRHPIPEQTCLKLAGALEIPRRSYPRRRQRELPASVSEGVERRRLSPSRQHHLGGSRRTAHNRLRCDHCASRYADQLPSRQPSRLVHPTGRERAEGKESQASEGPQRCNQLRLGQGSPHRRGRERDRAVGIGVVGLVYVDIECTHDFL